MRDREAEQLLEFFRRESGQRKDGEVQRRDLRAEAQRLGLTAPFDALVDHLRYQRRVIRSGHKPGFYKLSLAPVSDVIADTTPADL